MQITKKNNLFRCIILVLCMSMVFCTGSVAYVHAAADQEPVQEPASEETLEDETEQTERKTEAKIVMCAGKKENLFIENAKGSVKWSVGNKKILQILKQTNKKCRVKALKDGKTYVKASAQNGTITYKVTVKSGKAFVKAWCRLWTETCITDDMGDKEKLITASAFITSSGMFTYGDTYEPEDVLTEGIGTCVSGGRLLVYMCQAMGYEAKLRFAAKDDMSRYPSGVIFASQHYNVEVNVNGKKYYIDGTPGCGFVYLSTSKKPIYCQILGMEIPV